MKFYLILLFVIY